MGKIILEKLEFYACHGVYDMEKLAQQLFLVSLTVDIDMLEAAKTDQLDNTVDYQILVEICKEVMSEPKSLIEKIALEILQKLHLSFPKISFATVTVEKPEAQLGLKIKSVSVTVSTADIKV